MKKIYENLVIFNEKVSLAHADIGPMLVFDSDKVIGQSLLSQGKFQEEKVSDVADFLKKKYSFISEFFVDIGANIGTHTIFALKKACFKQAICVEPDIRNYSLLTCNIILNNLVSRVSLFNNAISENSSETLQLELSSDNYGDHRIRKDISGGADFGESKRKIIEVQTMTLQDIINETLPINLDNLLVWVDTQGYEGSVLKGYNITKKNPFFVVEFWPYGLERTNNKQLFFEFLKKCSCIYDVNVENWQEFGIVSVEKIMRQYNEMLNKTTETYYPHSDLLCIL